ncbi:MAG: Cullin repeat-like-containing domain protein [Lentinula lateritia]|nr:MAG: Cullin repeat-like-containing domain protein [Lentinula lateritia]
MINQSLVKKVVLSFIFLGLDNNDINKECLEMKSQMLLASNPVSQYLKKAEDRLQKEEDHIKRYLYTKTRKELISKCEHASFQKLLDFDQDQNLQHMNPLLSRIPDHPEPLRKRFKGHTKQTDLSSISKLVQEGGNGDSIDSKIYIATA